MNQPIIELYNPRNHYQNSSIRIGESDETTFSNLFRHIPGKPNIAFTSGKSFGETVAEQIISRGILKEGNAILEGGGDGDFANDFLGHTSDTGIKPHIDNCINYVNNSP